MHLVIQLKKWQTLVLFTSTRQPMAYLTNTDLLSWVQSLNSGFIKSVTFCEWCWLRVPCQPNVTFFKLWKHRNILLMRHSVSSWTGKLFRTRDLNQLVEFFLMFHRDKPVDWLLDHILWVKVCNPEKDMVSFIYLYVLSVSIYLIPHTCFLVPPHDTDSAFFISHTLVSVLERFGSNYKLWRMLV